MLVVAYVSKFCQLVQKCQFMQEFHFQKLVSVCTVASFYNLFIWE